MSEEKSRAEHLAWCKQRALEYVDQGDLTSAVASMGSDLQKHEDFRRGAYRTLTMVGILYASKHDSAAVRRWIEGFN